MSLKTFSTTKAVLFTAAASIILLLVFFPLEIIADNHLYHPHPSILSNPLYPGRKMQEHDYHPRNCRLHRSGVYLAVTSIGHGFPRVQFTCTLAHHSHPTPTSTSSRTQNHIFKNKVKLSDKKIDQSKVYNPAIPVPEQFPVQSGVWDGDSSDERFRTIYNDQHRTTEYSDSCSCNLNYHISNHDFIFSPREGFLAEGECHTTIQPFTEVGECFDPRPIFLTGMNKAVNARNSQHTGSVTAVSAEHSHVENVISQGSAIPEPMATLARLTHCHSIDLPSHLGTEQKVGPPSPTPEPFPA